MANGYLYLANQVIKIRKQNLFSHEYILSLSSCPYLRCVSVESTVWWSIRAHYEIRPVLKNKTSKEKTIRDTFLKNIINTVSVFMLEIFFQMKNLLAFCKTDKLTCAVHPEDAYSGQTLKGTKLLQRRKCAGAFRWISTNIWVLVSGLSPTCFCFTFRFHE